MGTVHTSSAALESMKGRDPDEPVVMLNLVRYRDFAASGCGVDGLTGRAAYEVYGKAFAGLNPRYGGQPIWMGRALESIVGTDSWDVVILVRYPTRRQFTDMMSDPDYQAISPIRAASLEDSRLIEMSQLLSVL